MPISLAPIQFPRIFTITGHSSQMPTILQHFHHLVLLTSHVASDKTLRIVNAGPKSELSEVSFAIATAEHLNSHSEIASLSDSLGNV
jgi:hypothetical protein